MINSWRRSPDCCKREHDLMSGSSDQVAELLAARFPKPDVRDSIRRLPTRSEHTLPMEGVRQRLWQPWQTRSGLWSARRHTR